MGVLGQKRGTTEAASKKGGGIGLLSGRNRPKLANVGSGGPCRQGDKLQKGWGLTGHYGSLSHVLQLLAEDD